MASFELAYKYVMRNQGMIPPFNSDMGHLGDKHLCSECFNDEGLRLIAHHIGIISDATCPNCGMTSGNKLTKGLIRELCYRFFVRGTLERFKYGGVSLIQMNEERFNDSNIKVSSWLRTDTSLIEKHGEIGLFYYEPRFWMLGEIEPLKSMQNESEINDVVERILNLYPIYTLTESHPFYRVRVNPSIPDEFAQYDSPPESCNGNNRFDEIDFPVLYASPDLELCLHECRVTVDDNLFVATLVPKQQLKMLNLAHLLREQDVTEFTSLDLAVHFLFLAGKHSYHICRHIAKHIREKGFDGIIYPSYFSHIRTGTLPFDTVGGLSVRILPQLNDYAQGQSVPNVALFGRPIEEGKVVVKSIDRVVINSITYETSFGPSFVGSRVNSMNSDDYLALRTTEYEEGLKKILNK